MIGNFVFSKFSSQLVLYLNSILNFDILYFIFYNFYFFSTYFFIKSFLYYLVHVFLQIDLRIMTNQYVKVPRTGTHELIRGSPHFNELCNYEPAIKKAKHEHVG
jgi:hypothetical protein